MKDAVIVSAVRTPIGNFNGALAPCDAVTLGATVVEEACRRAQIGNDAPQEVFMGHVLQAGQGQNTARQAAIRAGLDYAIPACTLNRVCGSGLNAVMLGAQSIRAGDLSCVVAGGMESMSNAPYVLQKARWGLRMGDASLVDTVLRDGLTDVFNEYHMGITAENLAKTFGISREEQDSFALNSQRKAIAAIDAGNFVEEIVPVSIEGKKGCVVIGQDEFPRRDSSTEGLARLRPAFRKDGTVTAGNASGINDGAAAMVLMSAENARARELRPLARIAGYATAGVDPAYMGIGPVPSTRAALKMAGWKMEDVDYIEANEAFAAQCISVARELDMDPEKVNVCGGAIALGHPIGASGARILVTLLHILRQRGGKRGLATLCVGGGQGVSLLVESI